MILLGVVAPLASAQETAPPPPLDSPTGASANPTIGPGTDAAEQAPRLTLRELFVIQTDRYDSVANNPKLLPTALPTAIHKTGRTKKTNHANQYQYKAMPLGIITFQGTIDQPIKLRVELQSAAGGIQAHWPMDAKVGRQLVQWDSIQQANDQQRPQLFPPNQGDWLEPLRASNDRLWLQSRDPLRKERFFLYDAAFTFKPAVKLEFDQGQYRLKAETAPPLSVLLRKSDAGWSADTIAEPWNTASPTIATKTINATSPDLQDALTPIQNFLHQRGYNAHEANIALDMIASAGFDKSRFSFVYILPDHEVNDYVKLKVQPQPDQITRTVIVVVNNVDPDLGSRINALIDDLGSDQWIKREHAQRELTSLGKAAIKKIQQLKRHQDPEIVFRAQQILDDYDWKYKDRN